MADSPLRLLFVLNGRSGRDRNFNWEAAIKGYFGSLHHNILIFKMPEQDAKSLLVKEITQFNPDRVVAIGGDGTINFTAEVLLGTGIPLGIIPAGSANGMARELNIPAEPGEAFGIVLNGKISPTDVVRINDKHISLHLADLGLNARLVKYFEDRGIRGKIGYALALIKAFYRRRRLNVWIESEEKAVERKAIMVILANAGKYGTGATINPVSDLGDGKFEIVIVKKLHPSELIKMFLKYQRFNPGNIEVFSASSVRIETSRNMHFQVDGEYLGKTRKVTAHSMKGALLLIRPH